MKLPENKITRFFYDIASWIFVLLGTSYTIAQCRKMLINAEKYKPYDIIIVPGRPYNTNKMELIMRIRIFWAKYLLDNNIAKNVMFSGAAVYTPYCEARIMALYAKAIGIPEEKIFIETEAMHSVENVLFSYNKALKSGFKKIALASDPVQTKMLRKFTHNKVSKDIILIPIIYRIVENIKNVNREIIIDTAEAFVADFIPLKEKTRLKERFRGTLGKNIRQNH